MQNKNAMAKSKPAHEPIPEQFATVDEAAEFWDTHSLADYWDFTEEVDFKVDLRPEGGQGDKVTR